MSNEVMKDSGIEWIGKIPKSWKLEILKRTTHIKGRIGWQGLTSDEYLSEGYFLLVTGTDFKAKYIDWDTCHYVEEDRYLEDSNIQLQEDDVLVTKDGTIGKIAMVKNMPFPATLNSGVFVTRPLKKQYLQSFMYWILSSDIFPEFIHYSKVGTTIVHLYQKVFERFKYPIPPLPEQKLIVDYLDQRCGKLDTIIAIKQQQIKTLDALRQSIIYHAVTKGLDDSVPLVDSGVEWLGKIPKEWKICRVKDVLAFFNTMRIPLSSADRGLMENKAYDYYGASGVIDKVDDFIFDGIYILVAEDGANLLTRNTPLAFIATGQFWVNNHAHILKPRLGNIKYFSLLLESMDYSLFVTGAAQPKLTKENLGNFTILSPPRHEQQRIVDYLELETKRLDQLKSNLNQQITTLQAYKKSLIYECVTGKKRIRPDDLKAG